MRIERIPILVLLIWALPAEEPKPVSPFAPNAQSPPRTDARPGTVAMSDGSTIEGLAMFTRGRKLEIFEEARQKWHALALADIARLDNEVVKEEKEREWRFKEGGNDEKVYTGRVFIDHQYRMTVTLADGKTKIVGRIRGMALYVRPAGEEPRRILLHSDYRGAFGGEARDLVYFKSLVLAAPGPGKDDERSTERSVGKKDASPAPP